MVRRWGAWLLVLAVLAAMAALRLTDSKVRVGREPEGLRPPAPEAPGGDR